ncbi:MAG TPA: hypothetical protein VJ011_06990, partial [Steroidobacteraceae bacterium]|nr:hypothetical protein [Steroidobacteraceae bacterium]
MTARRFLRAVAGKAAACAVVCTLASSIAISDADPVRDAWKLEGYEVDGQAREADGILLFQDGRFGMVYTMRSAGGPLSARAHAGVYRVAGDRLHFDVRWWVEDVDGAARVVPGVTREPRLALDGDRLALHFANGSVQHLRRMPAPAAPQAEGAWQVRTVRAPNAAAAPATGLLVAAGGQFALIY